MQLVHSSEKTVFTLSTLIEEGQALAQSEQSMHVFVLRLIFCGLSRESNPNKAP